LLDETIVRQKYNKISTEETRTKTKQDKDQKQNKNKTKSNTFPKLSYQHDQFPPSIIFIFRFLIIRHLILPGLFPMARIQRLRMGIINVVGVPGPISQRFVHNWPSWRIVRGLSRWMIMDNIASREMVITFGVVFFMLLQFRSVYLFHVFTILPNIFGDWLPNTEYKSCLGNPVE
jgi:hypothetical protein